MRVDAHFGNAHLLPDTAKSRLIVAEVGPVKLSILTFLSLISSPTGGPGLDFETWISSKASFKGYYSRQVGMATPIRVPCSGEDRSRKWHFPVPVQFSFCVLYKVRDCGGPVYHRLFKLERTCWNRKVTPSTSARSVWFQLLDSPKVSSCCHPNRTTSNAWSSPCDVSAENSSTLEKMYLASSCGSVVGAASSRDAIP
jgi:hypothetical protein